jgi:ABC-2 type transport system permease protein
VCTGHRRHGPLSHDGAAGLVGHVVSSLLRNIVLLVLAVTWLATAAGLLAGSVESANALGFAVCPALRELGVRARRHPAVVAAGAARHQPVTPVIDTLAAGLLVGTPSGHRGRWVLAWWGGLLVVSMVASSALFRRRVGR